VKILRGIERAIAGERVLSTLPPLLPYITAGPGQAPPRRRLSFFSGRALSHLVLTDEQRNRMADSARIARGVAPGVVDGFEVAIEGKQLVIMPGHAITAAGEDLELHYSLRLSPDAIPVLGSAITARLTPEAGASPADDALRIRLTQGETFTPGKLRTEGRLDLLPHAMVLVAQPLTIAFDRTGELDSPCPNAVNEGAYSLLAWEDGFQLVWVPWPADSSSPQWSIDGVTPDARYRNRLAYTVFAREREQCEIGNRIRRLKLERGNDENSAQFAALDAELASLAARQLGFPWSDLGAALALVGFDGNFAPAFSDRNSVVRQGGGRKNRAALTPFVGEDVLWQARVAQLIEQLAEQPLDQRAAADIARLFDWLPPAGVLPRNAVDIVANRQLVFPASYEVQAQAVPIDMVDALIAESAPLAPFNLSVRDQVQILVPVPARFFDPDLLKLNERIHPLFDSEVSRLEDLRLAVLIRRDRLRRRFDTLSHAITGRLRAYTEDDPDALPDETGALDAFAFARVHRTVFAAGETIGHSFRNADFTLELAASDELFVFVRLDTRPTAVTLQAFTGDTAKKVLFWGSGDVPAGAINAGELPADSGWVRLGIPVATAELSATKIDGLAFGVIGGAAAGEVQWGYAGKSANGQESYWVSDALPQGAVAHDTWEWSEQGDPSPDGAGVADVANGLNLGTHTRASTELELLISNYTAYRDGVLKSELGVPSVDANGTVTPSANPKLAGTGLDDLIARVDSLIAAANDHVEFGFLRARTDIYRVRQNVLGVGNAGRLLTSPTAAELITRNDNPVATDQDFADYFKRASEAPTVAGNGGAAATVLPSTPAATIATASAPSMMMSTAPILSALSLNTSSSAASSSVLGTNLRSASTLRGSVIRQPSVVTSPFRGSISATPVAAGEQPAFVAPAAVAPGTFATAVPIASLLNLGATPSRFTITAAPTVKEVTGTSLYGATLNTITVGERLSAKNASVSGKSDFVKTGVGLLADKGFAINDLPVFGYKSKTGVDATVTAASLIGGKLDDSDAEEITGTDVAESVYFKRGLDAIDNMVRFLRGVEIRVEDYKRLRSDAVAARTRVLAALSRIEVDLAGLVAVLAETRHDLAVARALRAEELQRVAALMARRKAIIAEHVPYLVFRRPRVTRVLLDVPVRTVQPGIVDDPVPRCREDSHDVPAELQAMVDTLKDVPAVWLKKLTPLILKFDKIDKMQALIDSAAKRIVEAPAKPLLQMLQVGAQTKTGTLLSKAYERQAERVAVSAQSQSLAMSLVQSDTWKSVAASAVHTVSASDLINTGAGSRKITLEASGELDDIAGVASCLYNAFCQVPASVRLLWAERFSQLDPDVSLRVLTVLPGFGDERSGVDYITWKQMQRMVDWLFSRVADEPAAIAAINDLVQVALLLSAHAPVKRIISARVRKPVKPVLHGRLDLMIDPRIAHIGMQVLVHAPTGNMPIARAVVVDLVSDGVVAQFAQVIQPAMTIDTNARVQLQSGPALTTPATAKQDMALALASVSPPAKSIGDMMAFREAGRASGVSLRFGK